MTQVFKLPDLGEGLTEAEVVEWHVAEGDEVTVDQEVVTVETAKAAVDVPCPYAGRVASLHAQPGQVLAVGQPLITVEPAGAAGGAGDGAPSHGSHGSRNGVAAGAGGEQYRTEEQAGADPEKASSEGSGAVLVGYGTGRGGERRARRRRSRGTAPVADVAPSSATTAVKVISPLVRKLATEAGLDLATVTPTGPAGVIRRADVEAALATVTSAPAAAPAAPAAAPATAAAPVATSGAQRIPLTGVRRAMADKLSTSRREIPDATTWVDVDATGLMEAKDALKRARPDDGIGVLALLARISVAGLARYPVLNSSVDTQAGEIVQHGEVNLGFAAQSPRGLVVPVVHGAHAMTTAELARALHELTDRAREGKLTPAQLTGGTFTLNNYGVFGVDGSTPIINHPEAAMLGVGRIIDRPWAHEGQLALRKVTQLSFTFDHRVCDGGTAGGFLRFVADCVENPAALLADL
jgi:2-oxoisovalerate dehydrogenase E2 component (dihydrolipoyl transacylase)